jgi:signal transduction histidine kinase
MKLQVQYNRITIASTLFILLIAAAGYYFLLRYVLTSQLDDTLKVEEAEIYDYIKKNDALPAPTVYKDQRISFEPATKKQERIFHNLEIFDTADNETEAGRQLLVPVELHGKYYTASVTNSAEATEDLVWIILFSTIALIVLLTAILFFTNRFLLKKLWQPFRSTLSSIKEFNLSAPVAISMQPTKITEFKELNESIRMMAEKVMKDYQSLKNFTDQASHEMQTPLAIINSKLDILIQEPELSEKSMEQLQGIYSAVAKLSSLCQSLLLMARIENNQYTIKEGVDVTGIIKEKKIEMQEWISSMNININMNMEPFSVIMNKDLAEILISNLFRNAILHSDADSNIFISTKNNKLSICNTGKTPLDKKRIFTRFYKSDYSKGSGLGLAIVQQICNQYQFNLQYDFENGQHCFSILFSQQLKVDRS